MTKFVSEMTDNEKCNNCHNNSPKGFENRELILKIIEDKIKGQDSLQNEWRNSDTDSEDGNIKCCSVCKKKYTPDMQMIHTTNEKYKPMDSPSINPSNNYGSINPVVVINVFKDENQEQIEKGGIINEAFLNEDETHFDLRIIPEVYEETELPSGSLKVDITSDMAFGDPELSLRRFSQDIRSTADKGEFDDEYETYKVIFLQVFVPFLIAGKHLHK